MCDSPLADPFTHCRKRSKKYLTQKPSDLRDSHLVRIDTNILDRITIDVPGKAKPFSRAKMEIGHSLRETMRQRIQVRFGA